MYINNFKYFNTKLKGGFIMSNNWEKGTICIQGGYSPKAGEPRVYQYFKQQLINMMIQII